QGDQVLDVVGISAPDTGRAGGQGEPYWIHRVVDVRVREGLRLDPVLEGRRGLSLREAIHAVVMNHIQHVEVPSAGIHEMTAADPETVPVAAQAEHLQLR